MQKIDFYGELAEYLGRDPQIVKAYCQCAPVILAYEWEDQKNDPIEYYRSTKNYIFDLTFYASMLQDAGFFDWYDRVLDVHAIGSVLDFGVGCGFYASIAAKKGLRVDYVDIAGSVTEKYAKYRFKRDGIWPGVLHLGDPMKDYDLIVAMDVFEHIADNKPVIAEVARHCRYMICNLPFEIPYNYIYPQHISKVDLNSHFDLIGGHLWRPKTGARSQSLMQNFFQKINPVALAG